MSNASFCSALSGLPSSCPSGRPNICSVQHRYQICCARSKAACASCWQRSTPQLLLKAAKAGCACRWQVLGWLMQCSKSPAGAAAVRLAVLLDMLYFTPGVDSLSSIEPACLVIVRAHPLCTSLMQSASRHNAAVPAARRSGELWRWGTGCQACQLRSCMRTWPVVGKR